MQFCLLRSGFRSCGPTAPTSGCSSRKRTQASSPPGSTIVSLLSSTAWRPRMTSSPRLLPAPKPMFFGSASMRVSGNWRATASTVESAEPLSTTITS